MSSGRLSIDNIFPRDSFESGSTPPGRLSGFSDVENNQSFDLGSSRHFSVGSGSLTPPDSFLSIEPSVRDLKHNTIQMSYFLFIYIYICLNHNFNGSICIFDKMAPIFFSFFPNNRKKWRMK